MIKNINDINNFIAPNLQKEYGLIGDNLIMFMAQCHHESLGFTQMRENLNYSKEQLLKDYKKYFNEQNVQDYAHNPVRIANKIYANKNGNGSEQSGDGYKFRGRGYLQLTGRTNYLLCGQEFKIDLITNPDLIIKPDIALKSALWYWAKHKLNGMGIVKCTQTINGGLNGIEDRIRLFNYYEKIING